MSESLGMEKQLDDGRPLGRFFLFGPEELKKFPLEEAYARTQLFLEDNKRFIHGEQLLIASVLADPVEQTQSLEGYHTVPEPSISPIGFDAGPKTFPRVVRLSVDTQNKDEEFRWIVENEWERFDYTVRKDPALGNDLTRRVFTPQRSLLRQENHLDESDQQQIDAVIHTILMSEALDVSRADFQRQQNRDSKSAGLLRKKLGQMGLTNRERKDLDALDARKAGFRTTNTSQEFQMPLIAMPHQDYIDVVESAVGASHVDVVKEAEATGFLTNPPETKKLYDWLQQEKGFTFPQAQAAVRVISRLVDVRPPAQKAESTDEV